MTNPTTTVSINFTPWLAVVTALRLLRGGIGAWLGGSASVTLTIPGERMEDCRFHVSPSPRPPHIGRG